MDKLVITAGCDSSVSYPSNKLCPKPVRENVEAIAAEYVRCLDAGASIAHIHGIRALEAEIQPDGRRLSRLDVDGWKEITDLIRTAHPSSVIQFGVAGARIEDRIPLLKLKPDMISVAFNSHDEHFQPDPEYPPNTIYSLHPLDELREYAAVTRDHGVKMEIECFHQGAFWNLTKIRSEGLLGEPPWATIFIDWDGGSWTPPQHRALLFMHDSLPAGVNYNVSVMSPEHQWKLLAMAIGLGGHVRVGAEDNPYLRPGELADTNARLVDKIVSIAALLGRPIATPEEARKIIGLG